MVRPRRHVPLGPLHIWRTVARAVPPFAVSRACHAFEITAAGLQVYPRLVSPVEAASYKRDVSRTPSGVPGLDSMLGGGFCAGSATLVAGPTGSGKTTMGIQFVLEGLRRGERCLLVNFQENPTQLAHQLGLDAAVP